MNSLSVAVLLLLVVGVVVGDGTEGQQAVGRLKPRYDYEYKTLLKLINIKGNNNNLDIARLETLIREQRRELDGLKDQLEAQRPAAGSVYTRWGRTTCRNGTELVYHGYAAGSHYTHQGGAVNPVCLPQNPDDGQHSNVKDKYLGYIYGAEYEVQNGAFFQGGKSIYQQDAPCAVCRSPRTSVVMVPGKNQCQAEWRLEYSGYLMSGRDSHAAASQYSCVDDAPESVPGGSANRNGYLFYMVAAACGSLKCPPYVDGQVLVCAVCSK